MQPSSSPAKTAPNDQDAQAIRVLMLNTTNAYGCLIAQGDLTRADDADFQAFYRAAQDLLETGETEAAELAMQMASNVVMRVKKRSIEQRRASVPVKTVQLGQRVSRAEYLSELRKMPKAIACLVFFSIVLIALVYGLIMTIVSELT